MCLDVRRLCSFVCFFSWRLPLYVPFFLFRFFFVLCFTPGGGYAAELLPILPGVRSNAALQRQVNSTPLSAVARHELLIHIQEQELAGLADVTFELAVCSAAINVLHAAALSSASSAAARATTAGRGVTVLSLPRGCQVRTV
jgi:hypothetical protein